MLLLARLQQRCAAEWLSRSETLEHNKGLCTTTAAGRMAREIVDSRLGAQRQARTSISWCLAVVCQFDGWARCGRPAGEEVKGILRGRTGLGSVGKDPLTGVTGEFEGFVHKG